jgi:hypothetical protein
MTTVYRSNRARIRLRKLRGARDASFFCAFSFLLLDPNQTTVPRYDCLVPLLSAGAVTNMSWNRKSHGRKEIDMKSFVWVLRTISTRMGMLILYLLESV